MNKIIFVTGASGSGKTTIVKKLQRIAPNNLQFCYFDSIGVPSSENMIKEYGSAEEWQRQTTKRWVEDIKNKYLLTSSVVFDGQMRIAFISEACKLNHVDMYEVVLFDCSDDERRKRLIERGHPELANKDMVDWAAYLRGEAKRDPRVQIIHTTNLAVERAVEKLQAIIDR